MKLSRIILILYLFIINACEEAIYKFENVNDPFNMDLEPPALFFHPSEIKTFVNSNDSLEVYGYKLDSSAAAHLEIIYDYGSIIVDSVSPGPFFQNSNNPIEVATKLYPRVVRGGSFMSKSFRLRSSARLASNKEWKKQDPQIPRSLWWHTDAQFLGFRVVRPFNTPSEEYRKKYWIK